MADDTAETIELQLSIAEGLGAIDRAQWDALANPPGERFDPFLSWDFLEALEASGCASKRTGWQPRPVLARDKKGALVGAAPVYLKAHSRGEFVFDHAFADALERAGGRYYPKLLCAVPFTPVTGRRMLAAPGPHAQAIRRSLARAIVGLCDEAELSSAHFNFLEGEAWEELGEAGLALREDQQFHWLNRDYKVFDDFLAALSSRKRKMIRKERLAAQDGLVISRLTGADLKPEHWDAFFRFYMDTGGRKWGSPYLNRECFRLLHERMADHCLLVLAYDGGRPIAGALNLIGSDTLYGRYWGRSVERPFLHFEVCYYQAIDFAIERGLKVVEAGAQGEHKLARGYEPRLTRSAHWFAHEGLRKAVSRYLDSERATVEENVGEYAQMTPFKKGDVSREQDEEGF